MTTPSPEQSPEPPSAFLGLGIGLISLALMSTEVMLTRLFSVVLWYHFAFFAISVALLGLGAGAVAVYALRDRLKVEQTALHLALGALVVGASILALDLGLLNVTPDWFGSGSAVFFTSMTFKLLGLFALTSAPFLAGGFVFSLAFTRFGRAIHVLYAWDLAGAGLACALVIPLLDAFGGPHALLVSCIAAALSCVCFARSAGRGRRTGATVAAAIAVAVCVAGIVGARNGALEIRNAKGLDLSIAKPEFTRWNSFSMVSVFPVWPFRGWGLSPSYSGPVPEQKGLVIDMNAFTPLTPFNGDFRTVSHTRYDLSAFAFRVRPASARVCIIGAGGGKDVLAALAAGSRHVTGVEVNPIIVNDVMRGRFRKFTGGLYDRDDVDIHIEDGRSFLRGSPQRFDVVLVSMVDTSAATAAGAFALAENALYTTDAFSGFLRSLRPGGMLSISSVSLKGLAVGARLASLARASLRERGAEAADSVAVVETPWLGVAGATMFNVLVKPDGFSQAETERIALAANAERFGVTYLPGRANVAANGERVWISRILGERDESRLTAEMARWELDVSAVDDDRPYFFYQNRWRDAGKALFARSATHLYGNGLLILVKVLVAALVMLALLIALPLWAWRGNTALSTARLGSDLAYVTCIGLGFMFLELAFIQRLLSYLGQPTYTLTAVLFVLLIGGGAGSWASSRLGAHAVGRVFVVLIAYCTGLAWLWPSIADATVALAPLWRCAIVGALLLPLGGLLGVPLPSALSRIAARHDQRIPWLWGINSAGSVLGSVVATLVSMHFGIAASWMLGMLLYGAAMLLWRRVSA